MSPVPFSYQPSRIIHPHWRETRSIHQQLRLSTTMLLWQQDLQQQHPRCRFSSLTKTLSPTTSQAISVSSGGIPQRPSLNTNSYSVQVGVFFHHPFHACYSNLKSVFATLAKSAPAGAPWRFKALEFGTSASVFVSYGQDIRHYIESVVGSRTAVGV